MSSAPNFLNGGEELGMPSGMRRRGLFQNLLNTPEAMSPSPDMGGSSASSAAIRQPPQNRIEDDPRQHIAALDAATSDLESRVGTTAGPKYRPQAPDEHMAGLESRYQQESNYQPKPLSLWQKIALGVTAPFGSLQGFQNERNYQQGLHQKNAQSLLQQIEAERRMQEQEQGLSERLGVQERGENLRAQMQQRGLEAQGQRLADQIAAQNQRQQTGIEAQSDLEGRREAARSVEEDKRLAEMMKVAQMRQANQGGVTLVVPGPGGTESLQRVMPGQQFDPRAMTPAQYGPAQQKQQAQVTAASGAINTFTRYQDSFRRLRSQLTPQDVQALQVLTTHNQENISKGLLESETSGIADTLLGKPLTGYSQRLMQGTVQKQQYDALSPAGKQMLADYYHAILGNFINMKQRMGTAGARNQQMIQAEMNAVPLPYVDVQSAEGMFRDTIEDARGAVPGLAQQGQGQGQSSGRRVIDLTK